jgi:hypothetical protein
MSVRAHARIPRRNRRQTGSRGRLAGELEFRRAARTRRPRRRLPGARHACFCASVYSTLIYGQVRLAYFTRPGGQARTRCRHPWRAHAQATSEYVQSCSGTQPHLERSYRLPAELSLVFGPHRTGPGRDAATAALARHASLHELRPFRALYRWRCLSSCRPAASSAGAAIRHRRFRRVACRVHKTCQS